MYIITNSNKRFARDSEHTESQRADLAVIEKSQHMCACAYAVSNIVQDSEAGVTGSEMYNGLIRSGLQAADKEHEASQESLFEI